MAPLGEDFPTSRLLFHFAFNAVLGSVFAYATWSGLFTGGAAKDGPFPGWTARDVGLVYAMGTFGAYMTPIGGVLYDRYGPMGTYAVGLGGTLLGTGGVLVIVHGGVVDQANTLLAVGLLYYVIEQGAAVLYMGVACDTLACFPKESVSFSMAVVALGYVTSGILTSVVVLHVDLTLTSFLVGQALLRSAFAIVRMAFLGDLPSTAYSEMGGTGGVSYLGAMTSAPFLAMMLLSMFGLSPCVYLIGAIADFGDAVSFDGKAMASIMLVVNAFGRLAIGYAYMSLWGSGSQSALSVCFLGASLGFCLLALFCLASVGRALAIYCGATLIFFVAGGSVPLFGTFIREHFPVATSGAMLGAHNLATAGGNLAFTWAFAPQAARLADNRRTFFAACWVCLAGALAAALAFRFWPRAAKALAWRGAGAAD